MEDRKIGFKEMVCILVKSIGISLKVRSKISVFVGILGMFMALMPTLISLVLQRLTDAVQVLYGKGREEMHSVFVYFGVLAFCYLLQVFFSSIQRYYSKINMLNIQEYIKEVTMRCTSKVQYKYIDNQDDFLNKISFVKSDSGRVVASSIENILLWIQNLITFISMVIILGNIHVSIVIALLLTSIPSVILANMYKDADYKRRAKWMKEGKLVIQQFHDCCAQYSMNEVRYFGLFYFLKEKWRNNADLYLDKKNKMTKKHVIYNTFADILRNAVFLIILLIVVKQIFQNPEVGLGTFVLVINIATDFQKTTSSLFIVMFQFISDINYMQDFFDLQKLDYEQEGTKGKIDSSEIEIEDVTFTYPGNTSHALEQVTVTIQPGEKVAIVGENGSGKTTFINLILGLYEPEHGKVRIGGKIVTEALGECRKQISAIFQNFGKYEKSILENITISDSSKIVDEEEIIKLAEKTGLREVIDKQENGIHEVIGSMSDKGNNLSGGEWQRVAITRAIYREKSKIMILDEPTAALDPMAEAEVYRNFSELTGDRTTIFVSHRLGICKKVDRILVFDKGRIVEDGNHDELMKREGLYAKMYRMQAQWYN